MVLLHLPVCFIKPYNPSSTTLATLPVSSELVCWVRCSIMAALHAVIEPLGSIPLPQGMTAPRQGPARQGTSFQLLHTHSCMSLRPTASWSGSHGGYTAAPCVLHVKHLSRTKVLQQCGLSRLYPFMHCPCSSAHILQA